MVNRAHGLKTTETLLGIETCSLTLKGSDTVGLKTTETLLGIETIRSVMSMSTCAIVSKLLKPF